MTDRLILPMLDACVACLREGVVADEDTLDGAMIFATGFAPFRGGPMHYIRVARRGECLRRAQATGATLRRALPSLSGLGPAGVIGLGA